MGNKVHHNYAYFYLKAFPLVMSVQNELNETSSMVRDDLFIMKVNQMFEEKHFVSLFIEIIILLIIIGFSFEAVVAIV